MWFSISELKEDYIKMKLDPETKEIRDQVQKIRKKMPLQFPELIYLFENIEEHVVRLLMAFATSITALCIKKFSANLNAKVSKVLKIYSRIERVNGDEIYSYAMENLSLSLPLCRQELMKEIDSIMVNYKAILEAIKYNPKNLFIQQTQINSFISSILKLSEIEYHQTKKFVKKYKYSDLKLTISYLMGNFVLSEVPNLIILSLPLDFFIWKYMQSNNLYFYNNAMLSYEQFSKHKLIKAVEPNITDAMKKLEADLCKVSKSKHRIHKDRKMEILIKNFVKLVEVQKPFQEAIKNQMLLNCVITEHLYAFIESLRMYNQVTNINDNVISAIERDILKAIQDIEEAKESLCNPMPIIDQYLYLLNAFCKFSKIEKKYFLKHYLQRLMVQGVELFYKIMTTDLFEMNLDGIHTVEEVMSDYFIEETS